MDTRHSKNGSQKRTSHALILKGIAQPKRLKQSVSEERLQYLINYIQNNREAFLKLSNASKQTELSEIDLYSIVSSSQVDEIARYEAYLCLIKNGLLTDLKFLSSEMNFDYCNSTGANVVLICCLHDRRDVLHWLVDELKLSLDVRDDDKDGPIEYAIWKGHIQLLHVLVADETQGGFGLKLNIQTDSEMSHPVARAAYNKQFDLLTELGKPTSEGGFGLDLNCRNRLNYDLPLQAANNDHWDTVARLLQPVKQNGFGFVIDKHILKNHPYSHRKTSLQQKPYIMFFQHSGVNPDKIDTLQVFDVQTQAVAAYRINKQIGNGGYGIVYTYTNATTNHSYAVKIIGETWNPLQSASKYAEQKRSADREYYFLRKIYPDQGPYMLQEVRKFDSTTVYYSFRMVMPLINGINIADYCRKLTSAESCVRLFQQVAIILDELHKKGFIHGDIRPGNILIETVENNNYRVRLIDFYFSKKIGKEIFTGSRDEFFAPESEKSFVAAHPAQDYWALGRTFEWLIEEEIVPRIVIAEIEKNYPVIEDFLNLSGELKPLSRPTLASFIANVENALQTVKQSGLPDNSEEPRSLQLRIG